MMNVTLAVLIDDWLKEESKLSRYFKVICYKNLKELELFPEVNTSTGRIEPKAITRLRFNTLYITADSIGVVGHPSTADFFTYESLIRAEDPEFFQKIKKHLMEYL